ncbi:rhodopsin [Biomphalaria pfeifferi]|uniref:Rhodopsin n=1 Tax=Biomphalaria pfeifferi TaxID=112525 RepID=A0AAD8BG41_BIOPF|nr:rhodopsin [Biomphalaria pfeifferi]
MTSAVSDLKMTSPAYSYNMTTHVYDTYDLFIHPHWYQFALISPAWHYAMGIFITFVSIFGSLGNLLVMYIFGTTKSLRTPSNMFIVNLSMSDFIFSIIMGFPLMTISCFNRRWIFGKVACELYGLVGGIFGLMSINTLAVIAFDRYSVIARPIKASRSLSFRKAFFMLVFVWCWSTTWTIPPLFGWGAYIPEGFQTSCTFDYLTRNDYFRSYILCLYIFGFCCPLSVILYCYFFIYRAVAKHEKEMGQMAKKLNAEIRQGQSAQKAEIKTARIAMTIVITYLMSWVPYATIALIAQFGPAELVTPYVSELPVMFAKASAMHNPMIYALSHPRFREALDKKFPWLLCCCGVSEKEKELASAADKSKMNRMDSVNSTAVGGNQSQMSEISNLDSDVGAEEVEPARTGMRMKPVADKPRTQAAQPDNSALVKDIMQALAGAMASAQAGQAAPSYLPPQALGGAAQDPQVQQMIYAISQGMMANQAPRLAQTGTTYSGSGPAVAINLPPPNVVTTQAEVNGGHVNKAYQAD